MSWWSKLFGSRPKPEPTRTNPRAESSGEVSRLISALQHEDTRTRLNAAMDLYHHPGEATVTALVKALKDPDPEVRGCAAESLRLLRASSAVGPLIEVLETDSEHGPKYYAIKALGYIRTPSAVQALVSALERRIGDLSELAFQLGELRAKAAVDALIRLLEDGTPYQRVHAAIALGSIGDRGALGPLERALSDPDDNVRENVAKALKSLR